ncbi:MAG: hypothetical protein KDD44_13750, partial [Bdellovibrionales bacterium]|nr:hypothetical protein [Bdellovibrionales bacterium]
MTNAQKLRSRFYCSLFGIVVATIALFPPVALAQPLPLPDPKWSGEDVRTLQNATQTMVELYRQMHDPSVAPLFAQRYSSLGSEFDYGSGTFKEHPWLRKPAAELIVEQWVGVDTENVILNNLDGFFECLDFKPIGVCGSPINPGVRFEYWLPQEVTETNDFGIGIFATALRPLFIEWNQFLTPLFLPQLKDSRGHHFSPPAGLRSSGHTGHSRLEPSPAIDGGYFLEAHTYRLFAEAVISEILGKLCPKCFNKGIEEQNYFHFTELYLLPFWKFPELSVFRALNVSFNNMFDPSHFQTFLS